MSDYRIAVNKVRLNFNREEKWNHHIVQMRGNEMLPFCGTKADLMEVDYANSYIKDIKSGKDMTDKEGNPFCRKWIASVLADGSDAEKDRRRINRRSKREQTALEERLKQCAIEELKFKIINKFLSRCLKCGGKLKIEKSGFETYHICSGCENIWTYLISCQSNGVFDLIVYKKNNGNYRRQAVGNILWKEPFIKFSEPPA